LAVKVLKVQQVPKEKQDLRVLKESKVLEENKGLQESHLLMMTLQLRRSMSWV
jgi:hypothetical protein